MQFLRMIFTWWHSQTLGTMLTTMRRGKLVGTDTQGNKYYLDKHGASVNGKTRRWVIYNGDIEASRVPPEWHGWLHYTVDTPPTEAQSVRRSWHKPHQANLTGTAGAHQPKSADNYGHYKEGYEAWRPE